MIAQKLNLLLKPGFCFVLYLGSAHAEGEEVFRLLESVRSSGRGNTYVAAYDSDEATRGNPATLAEADKLAFQLRWIQFDGFIGSNAIDTTQDLVSVASGGSGLELLKKFQEKFGQRQHARAQVIPLAMRIVRFEMMPFVVNSSRLDLQLPTTPEFSFTNDTVAGANLTYAHPFGKELSIGLTIRPVTRIYLSGQLAMADVTNLMGSSDFDADTYFGMKRGTGFGLDLGGVWAKGKELRFGMLVQNLGDTAFSASTDAGAPPSITQKVSVGALYRKTWGKWDLDLLADLEDLLDKEDIGYFRHLHLGGEFGRSLWTRDHDYGVTLGINEGYFTGGIFADLWLMRIDLSNYAVETAYASGQSMDRRWGLSVRTTTTF